jgi:hypothetical protein
MTRAELRQEVFKRIHLIEERCKKASGPTPYEETIERFQAIARADIPQLCRGLRRAIDTSAECPCCGRDHLDVLAKIAHEFKVQ